MFARSDDPLRYLPARPTFKSLQYYSTRYNDVLTDSGLGRWVSFTVRRQGFQCPRLPDLQILIRLPYRDIDAKMWTDALDCPFPKFYLIYLFFFFFRYSRTQDQIGRPEHHITIFTGSSSGSSSRVRPFSWTDKTDSLTGRTSSMTHRVDRFLVDDITYAVRDAYVIVEDHI